MKKPIYILIICILFSFSCTKDNYSAIPLVEVNIFLYENNSTFSPLNSIGGWMYETGGSRGIIVYRDSFSSFKAYDRHCTYDSSNSCALVSVDVTNITGLDDCCGSKFNLLTGSINQGPATFPLKEYQTTFDGGVLHIFN